MKNNFVIGVDIGGTTTSAGLVNIDGTLIDSVKIKTNADIDDAAALCNTLFDALESLSSFDKSSCLGIGIGAPDANYFTGMVEDPVNLPAWDKITPLADIFSRRFTLPAFITNDANAAAMGEMLFGGAKGMKNFILITLGTGLGSGIVVNGEILYGSDGFAGELGHTTVELNGRVCNCGKRGCLERYVSSTGICLTVLELLAEYCETTELRDIPASALTSKIIYEAAIRGDKIALEAFARTAEILGIKLADAVAHLSPEAIFLFGGLANASDLLLEPTRKRMEEYLFTPYRGGKVKLLKSYLPEDSAAVLGAAAIAWGEIKKQALHQ